MQIIKRKHHEKYQRKLSTWNKIRKGKGRRGGGEKESKRKTIRGKKLTRTNWQVEKSKPAATTANLSATQSKVKMADKSDYSALTPSRD